MTTETNTLVFMCMDFRFVSSVTTVLSELYAKYDLVTIAGASLMFNSENERDPHLCSLASSFDYFRKTAVKHIDLAIDLHSISKIVCVDHVDCGGYRALYGVDKIDRTERHIHTQNINNMARYIYARYPNLDFEGYIAQFDGKLESVTITHKLDLDKNPTCECSTNKYFDL